MKRTLSIALFFWGCTFTQGPQIPIPSYNEIAMGHFADLQEKPMEKERVKLPGLKPHLGNLPQLAFDIQGDNKTIIHINM